VKMKAGFTTELPGIFDFLPRHIVVCPSRVTNGSAANALIRGAERTPAGAGEQRGVEQRQQSVSPPWISKEYWAAMRTTVLSGRGGDCADAAASANLTAERSDLFRLRLSACGGLTLAPCVCEIQGQLLRSHEGPQLSPDFVVCPKGGL
jgi:hypothetical protein